MHENSLSAYNVYRKDAGVIRRIIINIFLSLPTSMSLTVIEIWERVKQTLDEPNLPLNSVAPRITELKEVGEIKECGFEEYLSRTGARLRRAKYRLVLQHEKVVQMSLF